MDKLLHNERTSLYEYLVLCAIVVLAFILRVWGIHFGLPHIYARPDEQILVNFTMKMFINEDMKPGYFQYPSLLFYVLYAAYSLFYLIGKLGGLFSNFNDFLLLYFSKPAVFYAIPRYISLVASVSTIPVIYLSGRRFYSTNTGLLAAFLGAGTYLMGREAHFGVTDSLMVLFCSLTIYCCLNLYEKGRMADFVYTGIFSGLAFSTKYTAALLVFPILITVVMRFHRENKLKLIFKNKRLYLLITVGLLSVVAGSPYMLLDFASFYRGLTMQVFLSTGAVRAEATDYWFHLRVSLYYGMGLPLLFTALVSVLYWGIRRKGTDLIILGFIFSFSLFMAPTRRPFVRYILPILPFIVLIAANGLASLSDYLTKNNSRLKPVSLWLAAIIIALPSYITLIRFNALIAKPDTRVLASEWVKKNIPVGSKVVIDGIAYNFPPLSKSPTQTRNFIDQEIPGFYEKNIGSNFEKIFPQPWYKILYISSFYNPLRLNQFSTFPICTPQEGNALFSLVKKSGAQYVITSEYKYLPLFTDNWVSLKSALNDKTKARLIQQVSPYNQQSQVLPQLDLIDAFFVPYYGFEAVTHPGPVINIYEIL